MRSIAIIASRSSAAARPNPGRRPGYDTRPSAAFLAHLIATAQHAPQTRARRRAEPQLASAHYVAAAHAPADHECAVARLLGWSM